MLQLKLIILCIGVCYLLVTVLINRQTLEFALKENLTRPASLNTVPLCLKLCLETNLMMSPGGSTDHVTVSLLNHNDENLNCKYELSLFFFLNFFSLTLTSSVQRKFAQGTNITTGVVHGLPLCDMGR